MQGFPLDLTKAQNTKQCICVKLHVTYIVHLDTQFISLQSTDSANVSYQSKQQPLEVIIQKSSAADSPAISCLHRAMQLDLEL